MSQDDTENAMTCITIPPEFKMPYSSIEPATTICDKNTEPPKSFPNSLESSSCQNNNNDPTANNVIKTTCVRTAPDPVNSDLLTFRLASLEEEEHQQEVVGNSEYPQRNRRGSGSEEVPILEYQSEYPIARFSRKWRRPEVQGLCCLAVEIICLATLAAIGLQAVGYFENIKDGDHLPLSFSWKVLWEFFGNSLLPKKLTDCLYSGLSSKLIMQEEENYGGTEPMGPIDVNYVLLEALSSSENENMNNQHNKLQPLPSRNPDRRECEFHQGRLSKTWLLKFFLVTNFMPVLNIITSTLLYTSLTVRRRKGMQVLLLLPSFFCFFVSIFQQIPLSFQYNYFDQSLIKEMRITLRQSNPPFYIVPILDETQFHHQCCGVDFPETWETFGKNVYPPSCCNSTAFDCSKLETIRREHIWSVGCFQIEHDKIHTFERWALFLYALKVIAEVGIFCTLSDLTRFDYPPPEVQETSRCEFREYQVKCRGVMHIKGVTKDGRIVVEARYFLPWRLVPSRTDMLSGLHLYMKTDQNQTKGSVEVMKRHNVANFLNEDIQIDLSRKNRGIFVFTLI